MQIKCLLELSCVSCSFSLSTCVRREGTKYVCRQGLLRMDLLLTVVGVENRGRISCGALFYNRRHVTVKGCWCSVKQNHQFLNKISTIKVFEDQEKKRIIEPFECSPEKYKNNMLLPHFKNEGTSPTKIRPI